jgi:hypothetical protein
MKTKLCIVLALLGFIYLSSCNDKNDEYDDVGSATVVSVNAPKSAYMGDSVSISYKITDNGTIPLSDSKLQLLYGDSIVSERVMITGKSGEYIGKIYVPLLKNIPDGKASLKVRVKNARYASDVVDTSIVVSRPAYPYLLLKTDDGNEYQMTPLSGSPYTYAVTGNFSSEQKAYIVIPKYGNNGNDITFGSSDGSIVEGTNNDIDFTADTDGAYQITFNTLSFAGTPFVKFALNDNEFIKKDDNHWYVNMNLTQNQEIKITGLKSDYANYWIDPTFFNIKKGTNGKTLIFRGMDGKYKVTVNKALKYFNVEKMDGEDLGSFTLSTGEGTLWTIGDNGIGKPSYATNSINWDPYNSEDKPMCLVQLADKKYQIILEAGQTIDPNNVNFKFFGQKGWGVEVTSQYYTTSSPFFKINAVSGSDGNIYAGTQNMTNGKYYILTLTLPSNFPTSQAVMTCDEVDEIPEVE